MQTTQRSFGGTRVVVLDESSGNAETRELLSMVGFDEEAARVTMNYRAQLKNARKRCIDSMHSLQRSSIELTKSNSQNISKDDRSFLLARPRSREENSDDYRSISHSKRDTRQRVHQLPNRCSPGTNRSSGASRLPRKSPDANLVRP